MTDLLELMKKIKYDKGGDKIYATLDYNGRKKKVSVTTKEYLNYVAKMFYEETKEFIDDGAIKSRLRIIDCDLEYERNRNELYAARYVHDDGKILIDMANEELQYVEVSDGEYKIVDTMGDRAKFYTDTIRKPMEIIPLEELEFSSFLEDLDELFNLPEDELFLLKVWLVSCMNSQITSPMLYLLGGAGTGKSSMQRIIGDIVDPSIRGLINWDGTSNNDLAIMLDHSYLINFDNVSKITAIKSDLLCQAITGGNSSVRMKYTDSDEVHFDLKARVTISSVDNCITHEDLASRTLFINVPKMRNKVRIQESVLLEKYNNKRAQIMSEILVLLSFAKEEYSNWSKTHFSYHRLAGFEIFGSLVASILDEEHGYDRFMKIIKDKYIQQIFPDESDRLFIYNFLETLDEVFGGEYDGGTKYLYDNICNWIFDSSDCSYPMEEIDMNYDRFTKMLYQKSNLFSDLGVDMELKKNRTTNTSAIYIKRRN